MDEKVMSDPDYKVILERVKRRHSKSLEYLHKVEKEEQMVDLDADAHQYRLDEIKKLEKEYADLRKIFDDTVGKLVSEKIAREITYATEIEQLTERNKQLEDALREISDHHIEGVIPEGHSFQSWTLQNYADLKQIARSALGDK